MTKMRSDFKSTLEGIKEKGPAKRWGLNKSEDIIQTRRMAWWFVTDSNGSEYS
jgi:hypothetical protein